MSSGEQNEGVNVSLLTLCSGFLCAGYWRILEFDYEMKLLNHVTQLIESESWPLSKVPLRTCLEELGSLEPT